MKQKTELFKLRPVFHGSIPRKIFILFIFILSQAIFFSSNCFRLSCIEISGIERIEGKEVLDHCAPPWGKFIWLIDLHSLRDRLATVPWIKDSKVKKCYPNKISITVSERNLVMSIAGTDSAEKWYGVDSDGRVLLELPAEKAGMFPKLLLDEPVIVNSLTDKFKITSVLELNSIIPDNIKEHILYYKIDGGGSVSFFYNTGKKAFEVRIGKVDGVESKIEIFDAMVKQMHANLHLLEYIDLRYSEPTAKYLVPRKAPEQKSEISKPEN